MIIRRPQDAKDIEAMCRLGHIMAQESAYANIQFDFAKTQAIGNSILADGDEHTLFARMVTLDDGTLIGMFIGHVVEYYFSTELVAEDLLLYMHPDHRGGTAAVRLVNMFVDWAIDKRVREVCLGITAGINDTAAKLYERLGFRCAGTFHKREI